MLFYNGDTKCYFITVIQNVILYQWYKMTFCITDTKCYFVSVIQNVICNSVTKYYFVTIMLQNVVILWWDKFMGAQLSGPWKCFINNIYYTESRLPLVTAELTEIFSESY